MPGIFFSSYLGQENAALSAIGEIYWPYQTKEPYGPDAWRKWTGIENGTSTLETDHWTP